MGTVPIPGAVAGDVAIECPTPPTVVEHGCSQSLTAVVIVLPCTWSVRRGFLPQRSPRCGRLRLFRTAGRVIECGSGRLS